jgi:hypothetical protein
VNSTLGSEPVLTHNHRGRRHEWRVAGASLTVGPISAAEHLAFVQTQRSVSFLQTPAWGRVKTEWRSESLGWYDGRQLDGRRARPAPPSAATRALHAGLRGRGPAIEWTGKIDVWLDPLTTYLMAQGAFAIRLGPPVRTNTWSAAQVKEGIADPGIKREIPSQQADPVGARVTNQLRDYGWPPQSRRMGISIREPGMPMTVSRNSPSTKHPVLDPQAQPYEERRHGVKVRDGDADVIEASRCVT